MRTIVPYANEKITTLAYASVVFLLPAYTFNKYKINSKMLLTPDNGHDILYTRSPITGIKEEVKMKNVMVRAWEIARKAVARFGGSVKEYFSSALAMAWAEVKTATENFGFTVIKKLNGSLYFVVENVEGLKIATVRTEKSGMTGKMITKRDFFGGQLVIEKETGKEMLYFRIALGSYTVEFSANGKVSLLDIANGALNWR